MFAAVVFVTFILIVIFFFSQYCKKQYTRIPGPKRTDKSSGNLNDIKKAGSLYEYLLKAHSKYGHILQFWMGEEKTISIASPELFLKVTNLFDRPPEVYKLFEPLVGPKAIIFVNGMEGQQRHKLYEQCFGHLEIKSIYPLLNQICDELLEKWYRTTYGEHIPLTVHMTELTLKTIARTSFGDYFKDDQKIAEFKKNVDIVWAEMEYTIFSTASTPGTPEHQKFIQAFASLNKNLAEIINHSRTNTETDGRRKLIDVFLDAYDDEEEIHSDALNAIIAGFHTTASSLVWGFYYLASNPDVQDKLFAEVKLKIDSNEEFTPDLVDELPYLHQVIEEILRCSAVAPFTSRFNAVSDMELGGYVIPKGTPIIQALGVLSHDSKYFSHPDRFYPEHFDPAEVKKRPPLTFEPFGYAGKRKCPGYRLAHAEQYIFITRIIRNFKMKLVEGQTIKAVHGLVSHPAEDIWVTIERRNS